uniref:Glycine-rich protein n=1 Tax=Acrobeloides nanus TaxID=290746 RepID=A0A914CG35_9BILA
MPGGSGGGGLLSGHDGHGPRGGGSGPPGGGNFGPPGSGNGPLGGGSGPPGSGPGGGLSFGPPGSGSSNGSNSQFGFYAWMILKDWTNIFYQFFVIIDTIVTLFLLRSYRSAFKIVGMKVWNIVKKFLPIERFGRRPTLTNINRPSVNVNQWMNSG